MNKEQGKHFRMFLAIQEFLDNQSTVWAAIPKITTYKNELDELISRISEKSEEAQSSIRVSDRKAQLKSSIALKISSLSGALQAFAHEKGDMDLVNKVKLTKSDIEKTKDQDLEAILKSIVGIAQAHLADLADYGIVEAVLTEILTSMEEFNGLIGKPRTILNTVYVALDTVEKLFSQANELLRKNIDNIVLMFRESNPDFYNGYQRARTIVDV